MSIYDPMPLVYPAQSKHFFFCRDAVCEFVLRRGATPLHPFRMFDYFLGDRVDRDLIRRANNSVVDRVDEVWVFGESLADGVLLEVSLAHERRKPVRFFTVATRATEITEIEVAQLTFEAELVNSAHGEVSSLIKIAKGELRFDDLLGD